MSPKHTAGVALVAVGLGIASCCFWPVGAALLWPTLSFAVVAAGYAGLGVCVFGKRPNGRLALWAVVLLGPYLLATLVLWHAMRLLSREPVCHEISPGLWLGRRALPRELPAGVEVVVDLAAELPEPSAIVTCREYRCLPTLDGLAPPLDELRRNAKFVAEAAGSVYIHCASGHGRSALVAAAALLQKGIASTAADAEARVARTRPSVRLSGVQRQRLAEFAETLRTAGA